MLEIGFGEDGLRLGQTFLGRAFSSRAADEFLGTSYRKREFRIGGKIERQHRFYDDLGIACLEDLLTRKVIYAAINLSEKQILRTACVFQGELQIGGVKIEKQMTWKNLRIPNMDFTKFLHGEFVWKGDGLYCSIHILQKGRSKKPDRIVQVCSANLCFDYSAGSTGNPEIFQSG